MSDDEAKRPERVYIRPPENFYELSEEEQLAWTRQAGEELRTALVDGKPEKPETPGPAEDQ
jgi:hypothetical protein